MNAHGIAEPPGDASRADIRPLPDIRATDCPALPTLPGEGRAFRMTLQDSATAPRDILRQAQDEARMAMKYNEVLTLSLSKGEDTRG